MIKISIIVPVYNIPEVYFKQSMDAIRAQTYSDYEVLLIDDGSNNGVEKLCDQYSKIDKRFQVIHQENKGVSSARNIGIRRASGKWLICLDPDDWWENTLLEILNKQIEIEQDDLDLIAFSYYRESENSTTPIYAFSDQCKKKEIGNIQLRERMQRGLLDENTRYVKSYLGSPWIQIVRKDLVLNNKIYFDETLKQSEDALWGMYLLQYAKKIVVLNLPLYHYRIYNSSTYMRYNQDLKEQLDCVNRKWKIFGVQYSKKMWYWDAYEIWLMKSYMRILKRDFFHPQNLKTGEEKKQEWCKFFEKYKTFQALKHVNIKKLYNSRKIYVIFYIFACKLPSFEITKRLFTIFEKLDKV